MATHNLNLLGLLNMAGLNVGAHEYFAKYMLADIKDILSSVLGNELDLDKIKWGGLTETTEFATLDKETQKEIIKYLEKYNLYYEINLMYEKNHIINIPHIRFRKKQYASPGPGRRLFYIYLCK